MNLHLLDTEKYDQDINMNKATMLNRMELLTSDPERITELHLCFAFRLMRDNVRDYRYM